VFIYIVMEAKYVLRQRVLSKDNIQNIVAVLLKNFRLSANASTKCIRVISENMNKYVGNIQNYPRNEDEMNCAIDYLNQLCYDDFVEYLRVRYPGTDLRRNRAPLLLDAKAPKSGEENIIVLTAEERNRLLEKERSRSNDLMALLSNPSMVQVISTLSQDTTKIVFDEILTQEDVNKLRGVVQKDASELHKLPQEEVHKPQNDVTKVNDTEDTIWEAQVKSDVKVKSKSKTKSADKPETVNEPKSLSPELPAMQTEKFDVTKKVTKETLPLIEKRINELVSLKNSQMEKKDLKMIEKIDEEIKQIKESVYTYKKDFEKTIKENNKYTNIVQKSSDDNILDLEIDPRKNHLDLKNIIVKPKSDEKIIEITLTKYFVPYNENNVTRFNNKFNIYFNNKLWQIVIPPSKYDIDTLLNYIKSQVTFLDFVVAENGCISIKNTMNVNFDLMVGDDTIFVLLGFEDKASAYKDKMSYVGGKKYNMTANEKVFFSLTGTPMDPLLLEFDKPLDDLNISLRKSRAGINIKQLTLTFTDENGQFYDFLSPFNVCMKIINIVKEK